MVQPQAAVSTKSEYAYQVLREQILSGALEPGQVLNQATLAPSLGVSTTPLREALRRLSTEGLVELGAHRDSRVAPLTAEEARDLLEMRRSLDPLAVSLAAERRTKEDIRAMREAAEGLQPLHYDPSVEQLIAHRRLHAAIYRASHNDLLIATLDALWDKADRYRRLGLEVPHTEDERDLKAAEHADLIDNIVAGDADGAAAVMRRHINTSLGAKAASRLSAAPIPRQ
ncbi:GntR family transcriptional regulator [Glycomyces sp. NPDC048151]|uniref:GntR family transcriptional regulator n=1 Tax=Glycomyces sp. NPDC048151 TaxID=3364002 RepID=UPI0037140D8C